MNDDTDITAAEISAKRSARHITAAQVTAAAAIVTSILALAVSLYETRIMRSWQQASTQPIVELRFNINITGNQATMDFNLRNMGQGAAYIEGIRASIGDETDQNLEQILNAWNASPITKTLVSNKAVYVGYLEPNGEKTPASLRADFGEISLLERSEHWNYFDAESDKTNIQICYCSVFDQCWINDFKTRERAKAVATCPDDFN